MVVVGVFNGSDGYCGVEVKVMVVAVVFLVIVMKLLVVLVHSDDGDS